jgi:hypothetical protein
VTPGEFQVALQAMDLNGDEKTSPLETTAYFSRNKYLLCRPFSKKIIDR